MKGTIKVPRRELDDTLIPVGDNLGVDRHGRYFALENTPVPRQSPVTRFMTVMTLGFWPWGKNVSVSAYREDRLVRR